MEPRDTAATEGFALPLLVATPPFATRMAPRDGGHRADGPGAENVIDDFGENGGIVGDRIGVGGVVTVIWIAADYDAVLGALLVIFREFDQSIFVGIGMVVIGISISFLAT